MRTINGPEFTVSTPENWSDITDEVEGDNPPFTLAAIDGYGALQFSVALFENGQLPTPSPQDLLDMLSEFGERHGLGRMKDKVMETEPLLLAATTFGNKRDSIRAWYVSDTKNFALVTHTCETEFFAREVEVCESIVRSIRFAKS